MNNCVEDPLARRLWEQEREIAEKNSEIARLKALLSAEQQPEFKFGPIEIDRLQNFPKKKLDKENGESVESINSIQFNSFNDVEDIINSIQLIIGHYEMALNAPLWRKYASEDIEALRYTLFKWNGLNGIKRRSVKHPPSWLNAIYKRARKARKSG